MLIKNCILWPASVVVSLLLLAAIPPLAAETPSDAERLQKLEQAVEALQKRNAQLESEISGLKKQQNAFAGPPPAEGKMKNKITYDGKTYVEKAVVEEKLPVYVQQRGPELKLDVHQIGRAHV